MIFRTDLALEEKELYQEDIDGVDFNYENFDDIKISRIKISTDNASKKLNKSKGDYATIEIPPLTDDFHDSDNRTKIVADEIRKFLPDKGEVLVIGIGNSNITPDALGPKTASMVLATRHIPDEIKKSVGFENIRPVSVIAPGVLGQTGIETSEIISSLSSRLKPSAILAVDALASKNLNRLGCTIQISNTGIAPGSGIGNTRLSISEETLGIPVIGIGIPTVVDAYTLTCDLLNTENECELKNLKERISPRGESMIVTPREIDLLIDRASKLTGMSINCALHKDFSLQDLLTLIS